MFVFVGWNICVHIYSSSSNFAIPSSCSHFLFLFIPLRNQRTTVYSNILNILCKEQFKRLLRFLSKWKAPICAKTILLFKDLTTTAFSKDFGLKIKFIVYSSLFFSVFFFHNKQTLFSEFEILFSHHTEFKVNNLSQWQMQGVFHG